MRRDQLRRARRAERRRARLGARPRPRPATSPRRPRSVPRAAQRAALTSGPAHGSPRRAARGDVRRRPRGPNPRQISRRGRAAPVLRDRHRRRTAGCTGRGRQRHRIAHSTAAAGMGAGAPDAAVRDGGDRAGGRHHPAQPVRPAGVARGPAVTRLRRGDPERPAAQSGHQAASSRSNRAPFGAAGCASDATAQPPLSEVRFVRSSRPYRSRRRADRSPPISAPAPASGDTGHDTPPTSPAPTPDHAGGHRRRRRSGCRGDHPPASVRRRRRRERDDDQPPRRAADRRERRRDGRPDRTDQHRREPGRRRSDQRRPERHRPERRGPERHRPGRRGRRTPATPPAGHGEAHTAATTRRPEPQLHARGAAGTVDGRRARDALPAVGHRSPCRRVPRGERGPVRLRRGSDPRPGVRRTLDLPAAA